VHNVTNILKKKWGGGNNKGGGKEEGVASKDQEVAQPPTSQNINRSNI
jgi:hypothetical protein